MSIPSTFSRIDSLGSRSTLAAAAAGVALVLAAATAQAQDKMNHPGVAFVGQVLYQSATAPAHGILVGQSPPLDSGQAMRCTSATDTGTYLEGFFNTADSIKYGKKSAKGSQKAWLTILVGLGDGSGGTVSTVGPLPAEACSLSWSLKDDDGDGRYNGGTDRIEGALQCDSASLLAMGMTQPQLDQLLANLGGKLGCSVSGVPTETFP